VIRKTYDLINDHNFRANNILSPAYFSRKGLLSFENVLVYILDSRKGPSANEIDRFLKVIGIDTFKVGVTPQAVSKAKQKINANAFKQIYNITIEAASGLAFESNTWHGYRVFAIDGSRITLPDLAHLHNIFGGNGRNADCTAALGSVLYDVNNEIIYDARIASIQKPENIEH
jgi:hypothetical protein